MLVLLLAFCLLVLAPLVASAARYAWDGTGAGWRTADRSSAGLLPRPAQHHEAVVRVLAAQTVRWRGIFAVHCWLVIKPAGAAEYTRYDYTAWGEPIRMNGFEPDGRWFGKLPQTVFAADGALAATLIPRIDAAIRNYAWRNHGDYRAWPGPNSNTFVAAVLESAEAMGFVLPPTAIGKDFPHDGRWLRRTPSATGLSLTLGGYLGLTLGWVEGIELCILGGVVGLDLRRPAIKLPGLGRIGLRVAGEPGGPAMATQAG
jgi:hypothetical protein